MADGGSDGGSRFVWYRDIPIWISALAAAGLVLIAMSTLSPVIKNLELRDRNLELKESNEKLQQENGCFVLHSASAQIFLVFAVTAKEEKDRPR